MVLSAIESIGHDCGVIRGASDFFVTPAVPAGSGPDFLNAAIVLATVLEPRALLKALHRIEAAHGRQRRQRWAPRSLDLDLLAMDGCILPDRPGFLAWRDLPADRQGAEAPDTLVLPHPRLQDRAFVLVPLAQALDRARCIWRHPLSGDSVEEMVARLPKSDRDGIRPLQQRRNGA